MPWILLLFSLFASVFTIGKAALESTEPFFFVGSRMFIAGTCLIIYQLFKDPKSVIFRKKDIIPLASLALFNIYLTNMLEFWGLQHLTSFKTCFIYSLSPFISALISFFVFSEVMTSRKWLGLTIGCIGFVPILYHQSGGNHESEWVLLAELAVGGACICNAYGWVLLRKAVKDNAYSLLTANGYSMLIGGAFALLHSSFTESWAPLPTTNIDSFLITTISLIIISNFFCYNLYGYLLKKYSATFISFAGFTTPIFAALYGWLFLGEVIPYEFYLSGVIVFIGLYLFNMEELKVNRQLNASYSGVNIKAE